MTKAEQKIYAREWRLQNHARVLASQRRYRQKNKSRVAALHKEWRKRNAPKVRQWQLRCRRRNGVQPRQPPKPPLPRPEKPICNCLRCGASFRKLQKHQKWCSTRCAIANAQAARLARNPEGVRAVRQKSYLRHKEKILAERREWRRTHPEEARAIYKAQWDRKRAMRGPTKPRLRKCKICVGLLVQSFRRLRRRIFEDGLFCKVCGRPRKPGRGVCWVCDYKQRVRGNRRWPRTPEQKAKQRASYRKWVEANSGKRRLYAAEYRKRNPVDREKKNAAARQRWRQLKINDPTEWRKRLARKGNHPNSWHSRNREHVRAYQRRKVRELSDVYIRQRLAARSDSLSTKDFPPELVEETRTLLKLHRAQLTLNRLLKGTTTNGTANTSPTTETDNNNGRPSACGV